MKLTNCSSYIAPLCRCLGDSFSNTHVQLHACTHAQPLDPSLVSSSLQCLSLPLQPASKLNGPPPPALKENFPFMPVVCGPSPIIPTMFIPGQYGCPKSLSITSLPTPVVLSEQRVNTLAAVSETDIIRYVPRMISGKKKLGSSWGWILVRHLTKRMRISRSLAEVCWQCCLCSLSSTPLPRV